MHCVVRGRLPAGAAERRGARYPLARLAAAAMLWAALLASTLLVWAGPSAARAQAAGIEETVLARRTLEDVPAGRRWVLRRGHPVNEDAHAHAGGFVYAATGDSFLVVEETQTFPLREGQAAWSPEGVGHLHTSSVRSSNSAQAVGGASLDIWTILLERQTEARRPGAAAVSPVLVGLMPGLYEARLVATTFQPGASTMLRRRTGPELAYTLDGFWELEYAGQTFPLGGSQGYLADPGVPHRLRNIGSGPARLLAAVLAPAGRPTEEPAP